jgi:REP element-mobilizing transposase RayT
MVLNAGIYPQRKKLPHEIPSWVTQGARHYITINCRQRGTERLCLEPVARALLKGGESYEDLRRWHLWIMLIMPDHIHMIATFDLNRGTRHTISAWKSYQAKTHGIEWQSDFFEHRLRNEAEFIEKVSYIRMNPVRKGLISTVEKWPYVIDRNKL